MHTWYQKLGFRQNPFTIKPVDYTDELVGYDLHNLLSEIKKGGILFIEGVYGTGKTSVLKKLEKSLQAHANVIYYAGNRKDATLDIEQLVRENTGFIDKILKRKPKNLVLFMDESTSLNSHDFSRLHNAYTKKTFRSIVFMTEDMGLLRAGPELRRHPHASVHRLEKLTPHQALKMIRQRVGRLPILTDRLIEKVFYYSGKNPRRLLKNCEELCRYAVENNLKGLSESDIDLIVSGDVQRGRVVRFGDMRYR